MKMAVVLGLACCLVFACGFAQQLPPAGGTVPPELRYDLRGLGRQQPRRDFPCSAELQYPRLDFNLEFRSGYDLSLPLAKLAVSNPTYLTVLMRVTPEDGSGTPSYFLQGFHVPALDRTAGGGAHLTGAFDLGPGRYRVDWLVRDDARHVCSSHGTLDAKLSGRDRKVPTALASGEIGRRSPDPFARRSRPHYGPLRVRVLVNVAPAGEGETVLSPENERAIVGILRDISREPRIGGVSLVAFNLRDRHVLYRQPIAPRIDFPALGAAIRSNEADTIDISSLAQKHGDADLLCSLISGDQDNSEPLDAMIVVGARTADDGPFATGDFRRLGNLPYPIFYLAYDPHPLETPWRDPIGRAVLILKGREFAITRPREVWLAWTEIMRTMASREQRYTTTR
jgi:hypothetical protein